MRIAFSYFMLIVGHNDNVNVMVLAIVDIQGGGGYRTFYPPITLKPPFSPPQK